MSTLCLTLCDPPPPPIEKSWLRSSRVHVVEGIIEIFSLIFYQTTPRLNTFPHLNRHSIVLGDLLCLKSIFLGL